MAQPQIKRGLPSDARCALPAGARQASLPALAEPQTRTVRPFPARGRLEGLRPRRGDDRRGLRLARDGRGDDGGRHLDGKRMLARSPTAAGRILDRARHRHAPNARERRLGLEHGSRLERRRLPGDQARQDAPRIDRSGSAHVRRWHDARGGGHRRAGRCLRCPRCFCWNGDEAVMAARLGYDGKRPLPAVASHTFPDIGVIGMHPLAGLNNVMTVPKQFV